MVLKAIESKLLLNHLIKDIMSLVSVRYNNYFFFTFLFKFLKQISNKNYNVFKMLVLQHRKKK